MHAPTSNRPTLQHLATHEFAKCGPMATCRVCALFCQGQQQSDDCHTMYTRSTIRCTRQIKMCQHMRPVSRWGRCWGSQLLTRISLHDCYRYVIRSCRYYLQMIQMVANSTHDVNTAGIAKGEEKKTGSKRWSIINMQAFILMPISCYCYMSQESNKY